MVQPVGEFITEGLTDTDLVAIVTAVGIDAIIPLLLYLGSFMNSRTSSDGEPGKGSAGRE